MPEIDEVILSLNYQPRRIEEIFGDGSDVGIKIRYVVEPAPLGTAGAIKYAGDKLTESVVVFNGDVLTEIDLARGHPPAPRAEGPRDHRADAGREPDGVRPGRDRRSTATSSGFSRSRSRTRSRPTTSTPASTSSSPTPSTGFRATCRGRSSGAISRRWSSAARRSSPTSTTATGSTSARPRSTRRCTATSWTAASRRRRSPTHPTSRTVDRAGRAHRGGRDDRRPLLHRRRRARQGRRAHRPVLGDRPADADRRRRRRSTRAIIWPNCRVSREAAVHNAILGRNCHLGRNASVDGGAVLGDKTTLTDFTRA